MVGSACRGTLPQRKIKERLVTQQNLSHFTELLRLQFIQKNILSVFLFNYILQCQCYLDLYLLV